MPNNTENALINMLMGNLNEQMRQQQLIDQANQMRRTQDSLNIVNWRDFPKRVDPERAMALSAIATTRPDIDISNVSKNWQPTTGEKWKAGGMGALDALLFGLINNDSYTQPGTENYASAGRLLGDLVGFAIPGPNALKAVAKVPTFWKAAKIADTAIDTAKGANAAAKAVKAAKAAKTAAKAAKTTADVSKTKSIIDWARVAKTAWGVTKAAGVVPAAVSTAHATRAALNLAKNNGVKLTTTKPPFLNPTAIQQWKMQHPNPAYWPEYGQPQQVMPDMFDKPKQ